MGDWEQEEQQEQSFIFDDGDQTQDSKLGQDSRPDPLLARKARERAKIQARREQRVTYDLPPGLREKIRQLAEEQRLPASQIVTLALARFLQDYAEGQVDLNEYKRPSRSPRYDWNLVLPARMLPKILGKNKTPKRRASILK